MALILASTSPYRREQLARLRIPFTCESPGVDEDACKALGLAPRELAERLAVAKAEAVAARFPEATIIGGDQLVSFDGDVLGKPGSRDRAIEQLARLAGRSHELITALAIRHAGTTLVHVDVTRLHVRDLDREAIARYVDADQPFDCAGSYKLESLGIVLFKAIESADQTAITGLPLIALTSMLRDCGYRMP